MYTLFINNMKKLKCIPFIIKITWLEGMEHGWGNGCVAVPEGHPLYGKKYSDTISVKNKDDIKFNGNYISFLKYCLNLEDKNLVPIDLLLDVHGGITFSGTVNEKFLEKAEFISSDKNLDGRYWVFGFDTAHFQDNEVNWPKERVIEETLKLKEMLENFKI